MKTSKLLSSVLFLGSMIAFTGCGKDDSGPAALAIVSIEASGTDLVTGSSVDLDLNGASVASDVPVDVVVKVTFDRDIDATTATSTSFSIGDAPLSVSADGEVVTISSTENLAKGTDYSITVSGVKAADGGVMEEVSRSFKTGGRKAVVAPSESSQSAFWNFDGNSMDQTGNYVTSGEVAVTYGVDRFGFAESAVVFDGDATIIEIADADLMMASNDYTLSWWMKTNSEGHVNENGDPAAQFVFGLAAFYGFRLEIPSGYNNLNLAHRWQIDNGVDDPYVRNEGFSFNGDGVYNETGGWKGHTFEKDLTETGGLEALVKDRWTHIVFSYNATTKVGSIYIDGELMKSQDFNLYGETHPQFNCVGWGYGGEEPTTYPELAFGFIHSRAGSLWDTTPWGSYDVPTANHYKGMLDDFRVFSAPYSADDVLQLYNDEKP